MQLIYIEDVTCWNNKWAWSANRGKKCSKHTAVLECFVTG